MAKDRRDNDPIEIDFGWELDTGTGIVVRSDGEAHGQRVRTPYQEPPVAPGATGGSRVSNRTGNAPQGSTAGDTAGRTGGRIMHFVFDVAAPPSTNNLYFNVPGRGRVVTKEYDAWRTAAALSLRWPRYPSPNRTRWEIEIALHALPHTRDVSNTIKAIEDLVARQTGLKDNYCEVVTAFRSGMDDGAARATVTVTVLDWPALDKGKQEGA